MFVLCNDLCFRVHRWLFGSIIVLSGVLSSFKTIEKDGGSQRKEKCRKEIFYFGVTGRRRKTRFLGREEAKDMEVVQYLWSIAA